MEMLPPVSQWGSAAKVLYAYARLRRRKGVLGSDFIYRTLRGAAKRWTGPRHNARAPLITSIAINSACPLECFHCSADGVGGSLSREDLLQTIDGIVATGCQVIVITGGEPLICKHLIEVIERIPLDVTVSLYTSGYRLSEEQAAFFRARQNMLVCFSLDHGEEEEHDRRRGLPGAYAGVMRGLELLKGGHCERQISSLVTPDRLHSGELERFVRGLAGMGVSCVQWFQARPVGRLTGDMSHCLSPEEEIEVWAVANQLNQDPSLPLVVAHPAIQHANLLGCCAGYARMYIDSKGHVNPCDFAPLSFGEVTKEPVPVLWNRMRSFFDRPGSMCLSRDMPDLWEGKKGRHVPIETVKDKDRLRTSPPAVYENYGEGFYRLLLGSLALAAVAAREWPHGAVKAS
jgi:MoaA/NifB/PqqE/SkfB family radical SAM enzyme